jgi:hypothetical protein
MDQRVATQFSIPLTQKAVRGVLIFLVVLVERAALVRHQ